MGDKTHFVEFSVCFAFLESTRDEVFELERKLLEAAKAIHPNPITDPIDVEVEIVRYVGGDLE